jgi:hypothetical protein
VRDLLAYAIAPNDGEGSYLTGELEIIDGFTKAVSKYNYENLFVLKFEEWLSTESRYTNIKIALREGE